MSAELRGALTAAHEALAWLGRCKIILATESHVGFAELWAVTIACAELRATGDDQPGKVEPLLDLLGWDGPDGPVAAARAVARLERIGLLRDGRLV